MGLRNIIFTVLWMTLDTQGSSGSLQCSSEEPQLNSNFKEKMAGVGRFKFLAEVNDIDNCTKLACKYKERGDFAYLLDGQCFNVKCFSKKSCEIASQPPIVPTALAKLVWSEAPVKIPSSYGIVSTTSASTTPTKKPGTNSTKGPQRTAPGQRGPDKKIAKIAEHRLLQDIIYADSYNREVRPALRDSDVVTVLFEVKLVQIVDVDEKAETLKVNVWTTQKWKDPFLKWNPDDYDGISTINVEPNLVWLPVIILYNNAAKGFTGGLEKYKTKVLIGSNGTVTWFSATQFISSCKQNIRFFPFDEQFCYLKFGSWTYNVKYLDMTTDQTTADMSAWIKNGEWEVIDVPVEKNQLYYACCPHPYADITYTIHMKRKVLYYIFNLIIPTTIIVFFILVGFCLPPDTGERITLNITVLLTMTVFLNIASNTLPSTSDSIPLLGDYYLILMIMVCFAILSTCVVLRYYYATPTRMPERLRVIINEWIASLLFFVITKKPKNKGVSQWCGKRTEEACYDCNESHNFMAAQSFIVQNESNTAEERIALIEIRPKNHLPRANGVQNEHRKTPSSTSHKKSKSEPAINLSGGASTASEKRLRRRKMSALPKRGNALNTLQNRVMEGLGVLTRRVKEDNETEEIVLEWQFAAIVLDRLFFVLYSLTFIIPLFVFFYASPTPPVSKVEPQ